MSLAQPWVMADSLRRAWSLLWRPELRKFLLWPLAVNGVIFSAAYVTGYHYLNQWIQQLLPAWLIWLHWLLQPLFFVAFAVMLFFSFGVLANLIAAPFYSRLAARVEQLLGGDAQIPVEAGWRQSLGAESRRLLYLSSRLGPLSLLFLIPGLNLLAPLLWSVFAAWGFGLEYLSYPLENRGVLFPEQQAWARRRPLGVLSFGAAVGLGLSAPLLNVFVGPLAVIAAVLLVNQLEGDQRHVS